MDSNVKYIKGNIFTSKSQTLVNTVNCVGVMGAGIALEFKYRYPDMYEKYVKYCQDGLVQIGKLWIYDVNNSEKKILNFPTKQNWKYPSKYEYLTKGLSRFVETYKEKGITSVAFPMLGALNGGLDPEKVLHIMRGFLELCDIPVEIYEYDSHSPDDLFEKFQEFFLNHDIKFLEKVTGLKGVAIKKLQEVLLKENLISLIQLDKVKGIGEETVKSCYQFAMLIKSQPNLIATGIFSKSKDNEISSIQGDFISEIKKDRRDKSKLPEVFENRIDNSVLTDAISYKLFIVYCVYSDDLSGGVYESKVSLFIIAKDIEQAKLKVRLLNQFKQHNMRIDSVQEIEMVEGFKINVQHVGGNETRIHNHIFREYA